MVSELRSMLIAMVLRCDCMLRRVEGVVGESEDGNNRRACGSPQGGGGSKVRMVIWVCF